MDEKDQELMDERQKQLQDKQQLESLRAQLATAVLFAASSAASTPTAAADTFSSLTTSAGGKNEVKELEVNLFVQILFVI